MNAKNDQRLRNQRGSALFYIFITVALLAALSYAVLQSSRGGTDTLSSRKTHLNASEIINYANNIANAVAELRLNGTADTALCFDDPAWGGSPNYNHAGCSDNDNKIFHPDGGGIIWQEAPSDAMDSADSPDNLWRISGSDHITDVGDCTDSAACAELLLTVDELKEEVCEKINELLGIASMETETNMDLTPFQGTYSDGQTIGAGIGSPIKGKNAACLFLSTPGKYLFYRVLQRR